MFFFAARNWCGHPGSRMAFKSQKHQLFLSKTTCFDEKIKKTQCFFIVLGPVITRQLAFIFRPEWHGNFFFSNFQAPDFKPKFGKIGISPNQHRATKIRRATQPRATRGNASVASIRFVTFLSWVSLRLSHIYIYIYNPALLSPLGGLLVKNL